MEAVVILLAAWAAVKRALEVAGRTAGSSAGSGGGGGRRGGTSGAGPTGGGGGGTRGASGGAATGGGSTRGAGGGATRGARVANAARAGVRAARAGVRAARESYPQARSDLGAAVRGWMAGAPERRRAKVERRRRRAADKVLLRAGWRAYLAQRRQWFAEDRDAWLAKWRARLEELRQRRIDRAHEEALQDPDYLAVANPGPQRGTAPTGAPASTPGPAAPPPPPPPVGGGTPAAGAIPPDGRTPPGAVPPPGFPDPPPRDGDAVSDCPHTLTSHHDDGWWRCSACPAVWLCGEPDHNHFGGQPAPNAPPAPKALDPAPPGTTVIEGEIVPSSTAVASGEVRGIVDTRNALEDYLAELAGSQDDGADMKRSAEEVQQALRQAHARLAAEGLGEKTLGAFAAAIEQAGVVERTADDFIASGDTAAAKVRDTQGAVETHRGVEEASLATTDGGTTEYHRGA